MALSDFKSQANDSAQFLLRRLIRLQTASLGLNGKLYITDTAAHIPSAGHEAWAVVTATVDTVIASIADGSADATPLLAVALPKGASICGYFTSITLTSGAVIAYYV